MDARVQRKTRNWAWYSAYVEGIVCISCGSWEIEWHHRELRKAGERTVGSMLSRASIQRLKQEIEKCDPLCKDCHAKLHSVPRKLYPTSPADYKWQYSHCKRGHALTPDNIYIRPNSRQRECRACRRLRMEG